MFTPWLDIKEKETKLNNKNNEIKAKVRKMGVKRGFTLTELIIVVIILAILATFAAPSYMRAIEKSRDKEAIAMLKLIQQAEKMYRLETGNYTTCTGAIDCNLQLRLDLPQGGVWDYSVPVVDNGMIPNFNATAERQGSDGRIWSINATSSEPTCGGVNVKYCP